MGSNWDDLKRKYQHSEPRPQSRDIAGMYQCQICSLYVFEATYFPTDNVLKYTCKDGHTTYLEDFKLAF